MRLTLRQPTKSRAERFSSAFGAIGTLVGSLPIGVTAKKRKGPHPATLAVPVTLGAGVLGLVLRRRKGKSDPQDTWSGYEAPPVPTPSTVDAPVSPPVVTDAVTTTTEREKAEEVGAVSATDQPGVEGAVKTASHAGGETTASSADPSNPETQSTS